MSCKDKQKFKTAEASSKASLRTKGAIDKFLNILDVNMFNKLNKKWTADAVKRFDITGKLFYNDNDKAVANKVAFKKIDNAKGINYQKNQTVSNEGIIASEKTIRDLAAKIADRIGMTVKFESDRSKDYKGKIENNVAYVNLAYATLDTPIHEILGHPIIRTIKDKELYQNLLKELETGRGKEVLDRIKRDYTTKYIKSTSEVDYYEVYDGETGQEYQKNITNLTEKEADDLIGEAVENGYSYFKKPIYKNIQINYTLEEQQEEAIVELLGLMTAEKLDNVKDGKLISLLKRLLKEMKQFVRSLINQKEVEIDKLPDNMTLGDIADLLAYSNSKLILPGYEVEYTTPDNEKFKTYQEASNHITELAKNVKDVDLNNVNINIYNEISKQDKIKAANDYFDELTDESQSDLQSNVARKLKLEELFSTKEQTINWLVDNEFSSIQDFITHKNNLSEFISKNKEYEQSKEIIEEWKKVNNIQYNPEEIYSRGQEFSSVVGAYSEFDINLMMQNLLSHIEDNEKAGGKFAISAYTKPVDKQIGHLEGGGGKIKFKLYPQSNDILWAANTDVYSGSVWDASEKVNKDKKSELLGVSYTKYPSLRNVDAVQPNLADIVDNLAHHHNELGISLNFSNFEIEVDEDVPYTTKKIIENINKILQQKRLEEVNSIINKLEKEC